LAWTDGAMSSHSGVIAELEPDVVGLQEVIRGAVATRIADYLASKSPCP
jgi:hypothetical protein